MDNVYKQGMVASLLGGGEKSHSKGKLASLFASRPPATSDDSLVSQKLKRSAVTAELESKQKKSLQTKKAKKGKNLGTEGVSDSDQTRNSKSTSPSSEGFKPPAGVVHVSLTEPAQKSGKKRKMSSDDEEEDEQKRKGIKEDKRPRRDRQKKINEKRTVFVGNLPLTTDKKKLIKLFREFGTIENVRFRCVPLADPTTKKRVAVIMKEFHEKRNNISAYVCFKEEDGAKKALALNGHMLDGLHLRVDAAKADLKTISKRSMFVGNLPFAIEEESIRNHFEDCGEIENIRVIRDRKTNLGKGFCYILFKSPESVSLAMKLNDSELEKRKIRIERCMDASKKDSKKKKESSAGNKQLAVDKKTKKKNSMWQPTNASSMQVRHTQKAALMKKRRKQEKKRKNKSKKDEVTRVLGPFKQPPGRSVDAKKMKMKKKTVNGMKGGRGKERKSAR